MNKEKFLKLTTKDLPEQCYGLLPSDNSIIVIKKYETGYWETDFNIEPDKAEEVVNWMNEKRGITEEQRHMMELKSMNGNWED